MSDDVTGLLLDLHGGDHAAVDRLYPAVYDELRRIAHRQLRCERRGHTLGTTALVHEAYLRLVDQTRTDWESRAHFLAIAARAMRRILLDYARRHRAQKRGGCERPVPLAEAHPIPLAEAALAVDEQADLLISLDLALGRLADLDARGARTVELRFFGGLSEAECAEVLGVSARTVRRDWVRAKAWLYKELHPEPK